MRIRLLLATFIGLNTVVLVQQVRALVGAPEPEARPERASWPPAWLGADAATTVPTLFGDPATERGPLVHSKAAIIADLDRGEVLWSRNADEPLPIASVTKLASALTLVALDDAPDLDGQFCVDPEIWPPSPGARSAFETGACHSGWDFLGSALVHSDNRGAMAMPWLAGLPYDGFVSAMNETMADLGVDASFADPAGLSEDDRASARAALAVVVAVADHPGLAMMASAPSWRIDTERGPKDLNTTNKLIRQYDVVAAKTGYTDAAGYCFAAVLRTEDGGHYGVVVLGAPNDGTRFADTRRLIEWADRHSEAASDTGGDALAAGD